MGKEVKYEVDTPQKNPLKKKLKYGWMDEPETFYVGRPVKTIDAIFIGWTVSQAIAWAVLLNYKRTNILLLNHTNYSYKLQSITADEDLPIYLCGSWTNKDAPGNQILELDDCMRYLYNRGFEFIKVDG